MKKTLLKGTAFAFASIAAVMVVKSAKKHCQYHVNKCRLKKFLQKELNADVELDEVLWDIKHDEINELLRFVDFYENLETSTDAE